MLFSGTAREFSKILELFCDNFMKKSLKHLGSIRKNFGKMLFGHNLWLPEMDIYGRRQKLIS